MQEFYECVKQNQKVLYDLQNLLDQKLSQLHEILCLNYLHDLLKSIVCVQECHGCQAVLDQEILHLGHRGPSFSRVFLVMVVAEELLSFRRLCLKGLWLRKKISFPVVFFVLPLRELTAQLPSGAFTTMGSLLM